MKVPRPLLILVVVIVVLGVVACTVGLARDNDSSGDRPSGDSQHSVEDFFGPRNVPAAEASLSSGCSLVNVSNEPHFKFTNDCTITVQPRGIFSRILRMVRVSGTPVVSVTSNIRGDETTTDPEGPDGNRIEVSIGGDSPVVINITSCGTCDLRVVQ
jgi:hypothetical protein